MNIEFMAHCDQFMGPMAEIADIVLPSAHWLEIDDIYNMHPRFMIEAHSKVVEPPGRPGRMPKYLTRSQKGCPVILV